MADGVEIAAQDHGDAELAKAVANARRQRNTRIAGGIALAFVFAFFAIHVEWQERTVGLRLASSYFAAYSLAAPIFATVVGLVVCLFRGRSWFRFFLAFCIASALAMPSQVAQLAKHSKEDLRQSPNAR